MVSIEQGDAWDDYPKEAADFINQCVLKDPSKRLSTLDQVKAHPWFNNFDWEGLVNMTTEPLYVPDVQEDNFDSNNVNGFVYDDISLLIPHENELKIMATHEIFKEYYYDSK